MRKPAGVLCALLSSFVLALGLASPAAADSPGNGQWNRMIADHTGMCAAVGNNSTRPGAGLIQYPCDKKPNKQFVAQGAGTNAYFLRIKSTSMCVTPVDGSDHSLIVQALCNHSTDQQVWVAEYAGSNLYRMRNRATGLCMGVAWGTTNSGQPLDQSICGAVGGQNWRFEIAP
ncbi:RICIN domain-containing protein [Streptomyces sp. MS1.HAVA.3]|uniref:RICIN domain-containing protein n=1 Tax=Streptomyces caledonius TaxID=3134107 RepID=A0ABU8U1Y8_9ACTN